MDKIEAVIGFIRRPIVIHSFRLLKNKNQLFIVSLASTPLEISKGSFKADSEVLTSIHSRTFLYALKQRNSCIFSELPQSLLNKTTILIFKDYTKLSNMKFQLTINSADTIDEVKNYWSEEDYIHLLEKFNYPDADKAEKNSLRELLLMAITDFEPNEAAAILLDYKLADQLNEGQIEQISNDMLLDKIAEEYPEISLHVTLFHINQLLFKAFNGKFPNTKATFMELSITPVGNEENIKLDKESVLKLLGAGLSDGNLIKRLFTSQMGEGVSFPEANDILWELTSIGDDKFTLLTSQYWLNVDDITANEFESVYEKVEQSEEA